MSKCLEKCKPAVGAATAPSFLAYIVWYLSVSSGRGSLFIYLGRGVCPSSFNLSRNSEYTPSNKKRKVLPLDVVLSITSATKLSSSPKYNLLPIRIFLAGSTNTSHNLCSLFSSLNKKTSILAPVFSLLPNNLAGKTFVLFRTITSPSSKN